MFDFQGRTALVTGSSRGIGAGIATALARAGADVAVNYPPDAGEADNAASTAAAVEEAGSEALVFEADVKDETAVEAMIDEIHENWGPLDVLVNNAGRSSQNPIDELPIEVWDEIVGINLRGTFLTCRFAVPEMMTAGTGAIVNISSQIGIEGRAGKLPYSAAKGGILTFTRALAREAAPDVRVNAVAPGPIDVGKRDHASDDWWEQRLETVPLKRIGTIDDVVSAVLFLLSEHSSYMTGHVLNPDGGETMY